METGPVEETILDAEPSSVADQDLVAKPMAEPVAAEERIATVDMLRGFAVCGILAMNIVDFGWGSTVYENPLTGGGFTGIDRFVWIFNHLFFDMKMMTLFSMLFGAGLVLMGDCAEKRGAKFRGVYYRRVFWLLAIGLIHSYLIWEGDVLVLYAECGLILYLFRRKSPRTLIALGTAALLLVVPVVLGVNSAVEYLKAKTPAVAAKVKAGERLSRRNRFIHQYGPKILAEFDPDPTRLAQNIKKEREVHRGTNLGIVRAGAVDAVRANARFPPLRLRLHRRANVPRYEFDEARGFRGRNVHAFLPHLDLGRLRHWFAVGGIRRRASDSTQLRYGIYAPRRHLLQLLRERARRRSDTLALILIHRGGALTWLTTRFAAAGRMALTNYLTQSIVCTTLFYGYGFNLFARVDRGTRRDRFGRLDFPALAQPDLAEAVSFRSRRMALAIAHLLESSAVACMNAGTDLPKDSTQMRIVSLLPSLTELVSALGKGGLLVGVSHECDHPPEMDKLPKLTSSRIKTSASSAEIDRMVVEQAGQLYDLDADLLAELRPDLILTQSQCDVCAVNEVRVRDVAERLPGSPPVESVNPTTLAGVFAMFRRIGDLLDARAAAEMIVARFDARAAEIAKRCAGLAETRVVLLEWFDPPFNSGHWNPDLIKLAGGREMLGRAGVPSRQATWAEVAATEAEVVLLSPCGFTLDRSATELEELFARPEFQSLPAVRADRGRAHRRLGVLFEARSALDRELGDRRRDDRSLALRRPRADLGLALAGAVKPSRRSQPRKANRSILAEAATSSIIKVGKRKLHGIAKSSARSRTGLKVHVRERIESSCLRPSQKNERPNRRVSASRRRIGRCPWSERSPKTWRVKRGW